MASTRNLLGISHNKREAHPTNNRPLHTLNLHIILISAIHHPHHEVIFQSATPEAA
jgi:hypothetical protein